MKRIKRSIAEKLTRCLGNEALFEERRTKKAQQVGKFKVGDKVVPDAPVDGLPLDRPIEDLEPGREYTVIDVKEDPKEDKIKVDTKPNQWYSEWSFSRPQGVSVMAKREKKAQLKR